MTTGAATLRRIAVVGTGSIGFRHLQLLSRGESRKAFALSMRAERRRELRSAGFATLDDLAQAANEGVKACVIASDTGRHRAHALEAMEKGFHLLVEKPMAANAADARVILRAAEKKRRRVFVGCVLRFSESLLRFRALLPRVGRVHSVRVECQSFLPDWRPARDYRQCYSARADEGGVLRDLIHEIDYAGWIFGWPVSLQAKLMNSGRLGISSEESADLLWTADRRCVVSMRLDYLSQPSRRRMTAYGEKGTLEWDGVLNRVALRLRGKDPVLETFSQQRDQMYADQLDEFESAVFEKKRASLLATGADGLKALAVCDAARRSSRTGKTEKVAY